MKAQEFSGIMTVIGAAGVDIKGTAFQVLEGQTSNPGRVERQFGGVGRNIAENLACLGARTVFLSAVGNDADGDLLMQHAINRGIDMSYVRSSEDYRTGTYLAIQNSDGDLALAVSDFAITQAIDAEYIGSNADILREASYLVLDLNLTPDALRWIFNLVQEHDLLVAVDPTSTPKTPKILEWISDIELFLPNQIEAFKLCASLDKRTDSPQQAAKTLNEAGIRYVGVTMGAAGMWLAHENQTQHLPSVPVQRMVDATGAGDALMAGTVYGLARGLTFAQAAQLGMSLAAQTINCSESVLPTLSPRWYESEIWTLKP